MNRFFLIGYMGCGKTTSGRYVASKTNLSFIDMDVFIEEKYHKSITQIFADMGQDKFREIERKALEELANFENVIIATGGGPPRNRFCDYGWCLCNGSCFCVFTNWFITNAE